MHVNIVDNVVYCHTVPSTTNIWQSDAKAKVMIACKYTIVAGSANCTSMIIVLLIVKRVIGCISTILAKVLSVLSSDRQGPDF